jgi:hypothetical protein
MDYGEFVSLETATLAKRKGFKAYCEYAYVETDSYTYTDYHRGDECYMPYVPPRLYNKSIMSRYDHLFVDAMSQSRLQKWLRDNHNIYVNVASNSLTVHFPMNSVLEDGGCQMAGPQYLQNFKTYEEALEHGLLEALKLIKK